MPDKISSIVVLTGAGISAESGIKTFRASDGLWENHRVEDVATPEGFSRDPALVHRFYNQRRQQLLDPATRPNAAHAALARLQERFAGEFLLVTQNIDDLHERAGSPNPLHMHGELLRARCSVSGRGFVIRRDLLHTERCECCGVAGRLRPDIVWFGEVPVALDRIAEHLTRCDLFVSIGTSGAVYPAAGFAALARSVSAHTVELNLEPSRIGSTFDECLYGAATDVVPRYVDKLLARVLR